MLRTIGAILLFVLLILVLLAFGGALLLLLAYGLGLLVSGLTHFEPLQSTILALAAILVAGILVERLSRVITSSYSSPFGNQLDDEDDEDYEDDVEEDDQDKALFNNPSIPRWRQPLKQIDFSGVNPDSRCPCGSGRKYKNCHGSKQVKSSTD